MTDVDINHKNDLSPAVYAEMDQIRAAFMVAEEQIRLSCKESRETSIALTHLENSCMYSIRSIAMNGINTPAGEPVELTEEMAKDIFGDEIK